MKVKDLIENLKYEDPNAEVRFSYVSGDYSNTVVALDVESIRRERVKLSTYHKAWKVIEDNGDQDPDDIIKEVVMLSC